MKQGSLIIGLVAVIILTLFARPQVAAQDNDATVTVEPSPTLPVTATLTPTVETPTPITLMSLQSLIETKPNVNVGTWIIEGVTVEADANTQFVEDDGPLIVGGCALVVYFFDGTFNVAVTIESERLTVCDRSLTTPTPGLPATEEAISWQGTVTLQGRDQHGGINIFMSDQTCSTATFSQPITTTDINGNFEITTTQTYQCLKAGYPLYLSVEQPLTGPEIGSLMLKGGDVDGDGIINIIDIAALARNFETNNPAFDLNADGIIDIFDLVLAASNFQR